MKTIAERWAEASQAGGGRVAALPPDQQLVFKLMFYAGYVASIQSTMELADLTEEQAMAALLAEREELLAFEALGTQAVLGVTAQ